MNDEADARKYQLHRAENQAPIEDDLPPVVARMVVEVRSDGSRTVARGAIEDLTTNERVAIRADGTTPLKLASALAKSLVKTPVFARHAIRSLLSGRRRDR
jgi:hypothetical protein